MAKAERDKSDGTHHTQVARAGSIGVGAAVVDAMGRAELPSDLRRGVPGAEHGKHTNSIGFYVQQRERERERVSDNLHVVKKKKKSITLAQFKHNSQSNARVTPLLFLVA